MLNAASDRYFQQEAAVEKVQGLNGQYMLLSGEKTNASEFMHNNMQPFLWLDCDTTNYDA